MSTSLLLPVRARPLEGTLDDKICIFWVTLFPVELRLIMVVAGASVFRFNVLQLGRSWTNSPDTCSARVSVNASESRIKFLKTNTLGLKKRVGSLLDLAQMPGIRWQDLLDFIPPTGLSPLLAVCSEDISIRVLGIY